MDEHEKTAIQLLIMGAIITIAKLLSGDEKFPFRIILGRCILNAFTTLAAGSILIVSSDLPMLAILGLGAFFGTMGSEFVQVTIKSIIKKKVGEE